MADLPEILYVDQPESPGRTRDLGNILDAAVRALNYATMPPAPGLEYPGDVYDLLGNLVSAFQKVPQLADQTKTFLARQASSGTLAEGHGKDVAEQVAEAAFCLGAASRHATALTKACQGAQNAIAGLYVREEGSGA